MNPMERDTLRDVMRRVDEVRGLEPGAGPSTTTEPVTAAEFLDTLQELAGELERSHRRLIETNVQLVSLREVASSLLATHDTEETTSVVTRYLCRAFGFDDGFLLLVNRETLRLEGTWTHIADGRERSVPVSVSLLGDQGALTRATWLNRTLVHHSPAAHVAATLPDGHPLAEALEGLSGIVCVPLQRSQTLLPDGETHELCGARCILGDITVLAPPPGPDAEVWEADREDRQRHCIGCDVNPSLGVIGMARRRGAALAGSDVTQLESVQRACAAVEKELGPCDLLINGAGGNQAEAVTSTTEFTPEELAADKPDSLRGFFNLDLERFQSVIQANTLGTVIPCQVFGQSMARRGRGSIVNFASMNSFRPLTRVPAYGMAKVAIVNFTQWLAVYLAPAGIRVNAVAPGFFVNPRSRKILFDPQGDLTARGQNIMTHTPLGRFGDPADLLGCIRWLLSDEASSFVTGITVPVDGGFLASSGV